MNRHMEKRVFQDPMIKDKVTLIKTGEETDGDYILMEIEMSPGSSKMMHYHTSFTEEFIPVQGILGVQIGKQKLLLRPGRKAVAQVDQSHRFYNPGKNPIRFTVRIAPAYESFTDSLRINYGLAADGRTNKNGIPKKISHLAVLLELSDTRFSGFLSLFQPVLRYWSRRALKKGISRELFQKYCCPDLGES
jgi:mannose-6-phosphate isomerase-like protein (cupin superfamily)